MIIALGVLAYLIVGFVIAVSLAKMGELDTSGDFWSVVFFWFFFMVGNVVAWLWEIIRFLPDKLAWYFIK